MLQGALDELGESHPGIIVKIETAQAFQRLPSLLLAAMRSERVGVMIAGDDLAGPHLAEAITALDSITHRTAPARPAPPEDFRLCPGVTGPVDTQYAER